MNYILGTEVRKTDIIPYTPRPPVSGILDIKTQLIHPLLVFVYKTIEIIVGQAQIDVLNQREESGRNGFCLVICVKERDINRKRDSRDFIQTYGI